MVGPPVTVDIPWHDIRNMQPDMNPNILVEVNANREFVGHNANK